ncbi:hypothetical protein STAFG_1785 [Streptomyces afghaniensis 772]|uniref:Uncharacterized protein n=1 Tax=Streptomyces afghaniensis 772 TaxID=1283301 RepID=S4MYM7_9ACTN|nr:hypothetical protein STAFG_1785 [Streptomyces afghaniensis 772]
MDSTAAFQQVNRHVVGCQCRCRHGHRAPRATGPRRSFAD